MRRHLPAAAGCPRRTGNVRGHQQRDGVGAWRDILLHQYGRSLTSRGRSISSSVLSDRHPDTDFVFGDALSVDDATGARRMYSATPVPNGSCAPIGIPGAAYGLLASARLGGRSGHSTPPFELSGGLRLLDARVKRSNSGSSMRSWLSNGTTLKRSGPSAPRRSSGNSERFRRDTSGCRGLAISSLTFATWSARRHMSGCIAWLCSSIPSCRGAVVSRHGGISDADEPTVKASTAIRRVLSPRRTTYEYGLLNPSRRWLEQEP